MIVTIFSDESLVISTSAAKTAVARVTGEEIGAGVGIMDGGKDGCIEGC